MNPTEKPIIPIMTQRSQSRRDGCCFNQFYDINKLRVQCKHNLKFNLPTEVSVHIMPGIYLERGAKYSFYS